MNISSRIYCGTCKTDNIQYKLDQHLNQGVMLAISFLRCPVVKKKSFAHYERFRGL